MAHPSVVQAVEQRIRAGFSACPVYMENDLTEDPGHGVPWIVVDFPWCRSTWITADEFEEEGGFRVLLALETGVGSDQGRQWLDQIASLFRGHLFDGVQCFAPQSPMTNDRSDQANRFRLEITVPYRTIIEG